MYPQTIKAMVRANSNPDSIAGCMCICLLGCIENLFRMFNQFAFAEVALYGDDFVTAAKKVIELFEAKGFSAIINDNLVDFVIGSGVLICGFLSALIVGFGFFTSMEDKYGVKPIGTFLIAFLVATWTSALMLIQLRAAVTTSFVCWAEDPNALQANRPGEFAELQQARLVAFPGAASVPAGAPPAGGQPYVQPQAAPYGQPPAGPYGQQQPQQQPYGGQAYGGQPYH